MTRLTCIERSARSSDTNSGQFFTVRFPPVRTQRRPVRFRAPAPQRRSVQPGALHPRTSGFSGYFPFTEPAAQFAMSAIRCRIARRIPACDREMEMPQKTAPENRRIASTIRIIFVERLLPDFMAFPPSVFFRCGLEKDSIRRSLIGQRACGFRNTVVYLSGAFYGKIFYHKTAVLSFLISACMMVP